MVRQMIITIHAESQVDTDLIKDLKVFYNCLKQLL